MNPKGFCGETTVEVKLRAEGGLREGWMPLIILIPTMEAATTKHATAIEIETPTRDAESAVLTEPIGATAQPRYGASSCKVEFPGWIIVSME